MLVLFPWFSEGAAEQQPEQQKCAWVSADDAFVRSALPGAAAGSPAGTNGAGEAQ